MDVDIQDEAESKAKEDDRLSFSLSEEEAEDTADSLDIKPPQAVAHRKPRHKKDKFSYRDSKRSHVSTLYVNIKARNKIKTRW